MKAESRKQKKETGPVYGVELITTLPLNYGHEGGMKQAMPSRLDLRNVLDNHQGTRVAAGYEVLLGHWRAQQARIAELETIVDALDKTKDGVPIVANMKLYRSAGIEIVEWTADCIARYGPRECNPTYCYSTRAALEAARKAAEKAEP